MVNFDSPKIGVGFLFVICNSFKLCQFVSFHIGKKEMFLMYKLLILKTSVVGSQPKLRENHTIYNNAVNDKYTCVK